MIKGFVIPEYASELEHQRDTLFSKDSVGFLKEPMILISPAELEQREREAFESGFYKGAEAQDAIEASECTFADVSGLADDYLKQRKES